MGDTLVLVFDKGEPIQANELGELFISLARDYRRVTRTRTLVVERLESGSLIVYLRDATEAVKPYLTGVEEWAKAGAALLKFAKAVKDLLVKAKADPEHSGLFGRGKKAVGSRSVEALLKIATDSRSEVTIRHFTSSGGESLEINVTPMEALKIRETAETRRLAAALRPRTPTRSGKKSLTLPDYSSSSFAEALANLAERNAEPLSSDLDLVITSMVQMLKRHGMTYMLEAIAEDLERRGLPNLAFSIRTKTARN